MRLSAATQSIRNPQSKIALGRWINRIKLDEILSLVVNYIHHFTFKPFHLSQKLIPHMVADFFNVLSPGSGYLPNVRGINYQGPAVGNHLLLSIILDRGTLSIYLVNQLTRPPKAKAGKSEDKSIIIQGVCLNCVFSYLLPPKGVRLEKYCLYETI